MGAYLSIGTTLAIFAGGLVRWFVEASEKRAGKEPVESDVSPGSLFASGLIAAGGVMGLAGIGVRALENMKVLPEDSMTLKIPKLAQSDFFAVVAFVALAAALYYFARKPLGGDKK